MWKSMLYWKGSVTCEKSNVYVRPPVSVSTPIALSDELELDAVKVLEIQSL